MNLPRTKIPQLRKSWSQPQKQLATWTEQDQNTDDEKDDERFWKDLEAYEDTSSDEREDESDLGGDDEQYKEDPFYHPEQEEKKRQQSSPNEPKFTSNEDNRGEEKESSSDPDPPIDKRKESKRETRYKYRMKHSKDSSDQHHPTTPLHETTEKNKKAHPPNHLHQSF